MTSSPTAATGPSRPSAEPQAPRELRRAFWIYFAAMLAWAGWLCLLCGTRLAREDRDAFERRARELIHHYAMAFGDALATDELLLPEAYARRLAGATDGRYAVLADASGAVKASAGELPPAEWDRSLAASAAAAADFRITEPDVRPPFVECAEPVFVQGRRWGVLRWGIGTESLARERAARAGRLFVVWLWAALAGAAVTVVFTARNRR